MINKNILADAKNAMMGGKNISEYLRAKYKNNLSEIEIIEVAYDLQSGSYISDYKNNSSNYLINVKIQVY